MCGDLTDGYAIYEIKSSTKVKEEHLYDVAFQTALLQRCGLRVDQIYIVHLNSEYVRLTEKYYAAWTDARQRQIEEDLRRAWERDPIVLLETEGSGRSPCERGPAN